MAHKNNTKEIYAPIMNGTALLVIDVQRVYADPAFGKFGTEETRDIASKIRQKITQFKKAGVPVYYIYYATDMKTAQSYLARPGRKDTVLFKNSVSAFSNPEIVKILRAHGRKSLLVCGFNRSACVMKTAQHATAQKFDVTLLDDLSVNSRCNLTQRDVDLRDNLMKQYDVKIRPSDAVLREVRQKPNKTKVKTKVKTHSI